MFSNNKKPSSKANNTSIKSPKISQIPPSNNLEKLTSSFEKIVQPSPYDTKPQPTKTKKIPSPLSSTPPTSSTTEPDSNTKITRTTTTTTVTTVTTTTISAKNSPGQGPLYLDFGDFSLSPIEPDKLGSNSDDGTNKNLSQLASQKTTGPALVSLDNNISVNDPSSITIVSSKTSTDPVKIKEEIEQFSPTSSSSSNTLSSDSPRPFPSARPTLKGFQKVPHPDNSDPLNSRRQPHHYLKRIESAPVIPNLSINNSNEMYDSLLLSTKSMSNLNNLDPKSTTPLENKSSTETPKQYLERMQYTLSKSKLATMLAKKSDAFHQSVLKEYMSAFDFEKDPIDIALRKFLMECHLPKETQQIDRVMESFAKRYFDSNPDLFSSPDTPYVLAFSLLMLHTDAFNKSVKRKMTKEEFVKNTRIDGVPPEILEILYDNITFTQFIYADDDIDVNGQTILESPADHKQLRIFSSAKDRRKSMRTRNDPYTVIQTKIPTEFKPAIRHLVPVENPYSYMGTYPSLDTVGLHRAFASAHTIRVTGVQTRRNGETFNPTNTSLPPLDEEDGTFVLKITKGGKLGRKVDLVEGKKKGGFVRSWRQYGVILSGSQLMFFKDEAWFNTQMAELHNSEKSKKRPTLRPDVILMTAESVAVYDRTYKKHPHVFRLVCPKGHQYLFQAENENEMNDWITKINYAATFKSVGLKMRNINVRRRDKKYPRNLFTNKLGLTDDNNANDANGRANVLRSKIDELQSKISALTSQLKSDVRFRNNLFLMIPYKNTTRDRIIQVALVVAQRLKHTCLELSRLVCYHEILEKDLCATVMDDDNYWQQRKSMYRIGESSMEYDPSNKDSSESTLEVLVTPEPVIDNNKKEKHSTMTLVSMSSTSSFSTLPCSTPSSSITDSSHTTPPRSPDHDETFSFLQTGEIELEIKPLNEDIDDDRSIFKDDVSSIISLDFEDAQEDFDGFDIEAYEEEYERLKAGGIPTIGIRNNAI
ncbi:7888_t:CDS:2 [Funneliformis mosseae]|uniref:7888_t:CDS:1 n=1 Tax=Funneliformis mosseae TaxID=27381 RepID=A0A9N8YIF9_FUNMO|nr:7888_t:CDS:2 [Funneliformis mosseae]